MFTVFYIKANILLTDETKRYTRTSLIVILVFILCNKKYFMSIDFITLIQKPNAIEYNHKPITYC